MRLIEITDNFQNWFGNSKAVDSNGKPLIVYHGTKDTKFTEFDPKKIKSGVGFWFTDNKKFADFHTGGIDRKGRTIRGRIISAYLSIQNPASTGEEYSKGVDESGQQYDGYISANADGGGGSVHFY